MKYTYPDIMGHAVSEYIWLWGFISKILGVVAFFHAPSGGRWLREMPFGNEMYLSRYPGSCSFRIYMVTGVYFQNSRSGWGLFSKF